MKLEKIVDKFKKSKILVVGEAILDKYIFGEVEKLSPEAPVIVVNEKRVDYRLGGAANTANNIIFAHSGLDMNMIIFVVKYK